jgi:1-acyl-sn-glycerol-3-phosphate acyltransferase
MSKKQTIVITSYVTYVLWTIFSNILGATLKVKVDDTELCKIKEGENVLVISNHIGSLDFMIINELGIRRKMLKNIKYIIKNSTKYIPIFGWGMWYLGFLFIKRNFKSDEKGMRKWMRYIIEERIPIWFVIYPEGTRYTKMKREESKEFCLKRGYPILKNVLYPRGKGVSVTYEEMGGNYLKNIVDVTIGYLGEEESVPSMLRLILWFPKGYFKVKTKVIPFSAMKDCNSFLEGSFREKDRLIDEWKRSG